MILPFPQIHRVVVTTPLIADAGKQIGCAVPTMVLSETLGLSLFLVVRGGIGFHRETWCHGARVA